MNHHLQVPLPQRHLLAKSSQTQPDPVHAPPPDALHCAAEREAQAACKNGLMSLTWAQEVFGCPGYNLLLPSLLVPWLYVTWRTREPCWHHTQAHLGQEEGLPLPTNLLNPPGDLRAPPKPTSRLLFSLQTLLVLCPLPASLPQPCPCHLSPSSQPVPALFL